MLSIVPGKGLGGASLAVQDACCLHVSKSYSVMSDSLWSDGLHGAWNSPGQNTGVGSLSLLQEIFPTQEMNPNLLHRRRILYQLNHQGNPRILECSPSLLQWIFPTQESNWGLLNRRLIFYQLSYQESPNSIWGKLNHSLYGLYTLNADVLTTLLSSGCLDWMRLNSRILPSSTSSLSSHVLSS